MHQMIVYHPSQQRSSIQNRHTGGAGRAAIAGGGGDAKFHDLKAEMKENELLNQKMVNILKEATGLTPSRIKSKLLPASDVYMSAQEALDLGIADQLL
jgi:ATP-dependent protease ClpP protease subunit